MSLNRISCVLVLANLILILALALINSSISQWGFFFYLPGLFFLPHYQILEVNRSLPAIFISGLCFDHFFNHTLGFHAFAMCLLFLIAREFLHLGKQSPIQITIFQALTNLILAIGWGLFCAFFESNLSNWNWERFLIEVPLSLLFLIPLSLWFPNFCTSLINRVFPLSEPLTLLKK